MLIPKRLNQIHRTLLISMLSMSITATAAVSVSAQAKPEVHTTAQNVPESIANEKNFFNDLFRSITGRDRICLGPLCVSPGQITQDLVMRQLRGAIADMAPVTVSTQDLYPTVRNLPNQPFTPELLYLANAPTDAVIPPGDYIVLVEVYCLQSSASSPDGHRYRLGRYGGARQAVLQDLNLAATNSRYNQSEIQGLSWFIQSGGRFRDMPADMQQVVNELIPQHREQLNGTNFLEELREIGGTASNVLGYSSFESFLQQELGEVGQLILGFMEMQEELRRPQDWRTLSNRYFSESISPYSNDIMNTPWSRIDNQTYARFVTPGNADDIGALMVRIQSESTTVQELKNKAASLVAVPEGSGNIQPLGMAAVESPEWWEDLLMTFGDLSFFTGRQLCNAADLSSRLVSRSRAVQQLCGRMGDIQGTLRDRVPGGENLGIPWLQDFSDKIDEVLEQLPERERRPSRPANDNRRPPTPANDNRRPPTPSNDNRRPPRPTNNNRRPPTPANDNRRSNILPEMM